MKVFKDNYGVTIYECETCNTQHYSPSNLVKCAICGKEICSKCNHSFGTLKDEALKYDGYSLEFNIYYDETTLDKTYHHICKTCSEKINHVHYDREVNKLVNEFNNKLKALNEETLKEK